MLVYYQVYYFSMLQADLEHLEASEAMGRHKEVAASTITKRDQALK